MRDHYSHINFDTIQKVFQSFFFVKLDYTLFCIKEF